jgi:hypothetical protein
MAVALLFRFKSGRTSAQRLPRPLRRVVFLAAQHDLERVAPAVACRWTAMDAVDQHAANAAVAQVAEASCRRASRHNPAELTDREAATGWGD